MSLNPSVPILNVQIKFYRIWSLWGEELRPLDSHSDLRCGDLTLCRGCLSCILLRKNG